MLRSIRSHNSIFVTAVVAATPLMGIFGGSDALAAASVEKLQEFSLDQVQITDTYQTNLFSKDVTYLITTLDSDRLLAGFKGGLDGNDARPTSTEDGRTRTFADIRWATGSPRWRTPTSRPSAATQPWPLRSRPSSTTSIAKLKSYQLSNGFLFATPMSQFDDFDAGDREHLGALLHDAQDPRGPDRHLQVRGQNATPWRSPASWGTGSTPAPSGWSSAAKSRVLGQEYGGMNDALYELYKSHEHRQPPDGRSHVRRHEPVHDDGRGHRQP